MTQEEAKKRAEVMLAYSEGKTIQVKDRCCRSWVDAANPYFNWEDADYRVKPETHFVPFKDVREFMKGFINHSAGVVLKDAEDQDSLYELILIDFTDNTFKISKLPSCGDGGSWYGLDNLLSNFTFTDGTPCGELVIPTE